MLFLILIVLMCTLVSSDRFDSNVYVDDTGIVKTETSEYTDNSGSTHFEQRVTKQRKADNGYTETHITKQYVYREPIHELPFINEPSKLSTQLRSNKPAHREIIQEIDRRFNTDRPQEKFNVQNHSSDHQFNSESNRGSPLNTEIYSKQAFLNSNRKLPQDLNLNFAEDQRIEKDHSLDTFAFRSVASRTNDFVPAINKTEKFIEEKVKSTALENNKKQEHESSHAAGPVHRNNSDQEVIVNGGFKVYIGGGEDSGHSSNTNKNHTEKTILKDDGKIFFEPELNRHTTQESNIMNTDRGKEDVASTTEAVVNVKLDNRNSFGLNTSCEKGLVLIAGRCTVTD